MVRAADWKVFIFGLFMPRTGVNKNRRLGIRLGARKLGGFDIRVKIQPANLAHRGRSIVECIHVSKPKRIIISGDRGQCRNVLIELVLGIDRVCLQPIACHIANHDWRDILHADNRRAKSGNHCQKLSIVVGDAVHYRMLALIPENAAKYIETIQIRDGRVQHGIRAIERICKMRSAGSPNRPTGVSLGARHKKYTFRYGMVVY